MKAIVAVDENNGIGYQGNLLFNIPDDMAHFRKLTKGGTVVMGTNTWNSLSIKPLPGRRNIVLTRDKEKFLNSVDEGLREKISVYTIEEFIAFFYSNIKNSTTSTDDWWLIGGEYIYKNLLWMCDTIELTQIYKKAENVDTYFPDGLCNLWVNTNRIWNRLDIKSSGVLTYENENEVIKYEFLTITANQNISDYIPLYKNELILNSLVYRSDINFRYNITPMYEQYRNTLEEKVNESIKEYVNKHKIDNLSELEYFYNEYSEEFFNKINKLTGSNIQYSIDKNSTGYKVSVNWSYNLYNMDKIIELIPYIKYGIQI